MQHDIPNAAMTVCAVKGGHGATLAEATEAAGLGKGTLEPRFESKDATVASIVERHFNRLEAQITRTEAPDSPEASCPPFRR